MHIEYIPLVAYRRMLSKGRKPRIFYVGDARFNDTKTCAACGQPLITYQPKEGKYRVTVRCRRLRKPGKADIFICQYTAACRRYRMKWGGGEKVKVTYFD